MYKDVIVLVNYENFDFAKSLKESLKECISHTKGEVSLGTCIPNNIPELAYIQNEETKESSGDDNIILL